MRLLDQHHDAATETRPSQLRPLHPGVPPRGKWPVRKYALGQEPGDDLRDTTTAEERLAMMWPLALEAWSLMGVPIPDSDRGSMPVRRVLPGS